MRAWLVILLVVITLAGCLVPPQEPEPNPEPQPIQQESFDDLLEVYKPGESITGKTFSSDEELETFLTERSDSTYGGMTMRGGGMIAVEDSMDMAVAPEAAPLAQDSAGSKGIDFSETNNQVASVDEADIIKTDGKFIYTATGSTVFIIDADPAEDAEVIEKISLEHTVSGLFIEDDTLTVFGNVRYDFAPGQTLPRSPRNGMTYLHVYDISNKEKPQLITEYLLEGRYFQARMTDGFAYFVTISGQYGSIGVPRPFIVENDAVRHVPLPDIQYFDMPYEEPNFATIHVINMNDPDTLTSTAVLVEGSQTMYMAPDNMYIVHTKYINEYTISQQVTLDVVLPRLDARLQDRANRIKNVDGDILSNAAKRNKLFELVQSYILTLSSEEQEALEKEVEELLKKEMEKYEYLEYSVIHKIHVDGLDVDVVGTGEVPGRTHNQFALDEYKDVLRVATTINPRWSMFDNDRTESMNMVHTLDADMQILDSITDIAKGERIFSTRYVGDRLYMVTFRQVDPFFTIDLSDPEDIEILGELKIPGFSRYLHPYDSDTIIGIGRDATNTGRQLGLKISLFDVSDVENPEETAQFVLDARYSSSTAEYEHKAFLFSREKELLVIPLFSYNYWEDKENYNGALVFNIQKEEIKLRGLIDHGGENIYGNRVERSLYIEDNLFTKSPNLLRVNQIEDLYSVARVELNQVKDGEIPIY